MAIRCGTTSPGWMCLLFVLHIQRPLSPRAAVHRSPPPGGAGPSVLIYIVCPLRPFVDGWDGDKTSEACVVSKWRRRLSRIPTRSASAHVRGTLGTLVRASLINRRVPRRGEYGNTTGLWQHLHASTEYMTGRRFSAVIRCTSLRESTWPTRDCSAGQWCCGLPWLGDKRT